MPISRRQFLQGSAALSPLLSSSTALLGGIASPLARAAAEPTTLKISHQFPGGSPTEGDFRDRLCRQFAADLDKRSNGALKGVVYANSSLMKTQAQFSSMRKGALDMSLVPLNYAGGEVPEVNIGLMPAVVTSYDKGSAWHKAEVGKALYDILADKGVLLVSWIWQAGGVASRSKAIIEPEDAKGLKIRGGGREMDMVLKQAGAAVLNMPSNEIYAALQTGALDAAMTSSTSLISFRLEEVAKQLTTGRGHTYWFMFEPLMISRQVFEKLGKPEQDLIMSVGAEMEKFALDNARADDEQVAKIYAKAGGKAYDLSEATVKRWQQIARDTAWKDYAARSEGCARILKLVEKVL
jgi:TRAP-type C4-dicarboxylate transport system substrate-binding protein